ncbi:MAG: tyrosine-type recombinase/integrase [Acidobacteriota bacterium]
MTRTNDRRGLGSIFRRGRIWWVQVYHRNKRYRESSHSTERGDALRLLKKRLAEAGKGGSPGVAGDRLGFEDLATILIDDYEANERRNTSNVVRYLDHVRNVFGRHRAVDITTDKLSAYIKHRRKEGASPSTIRSEFAALRRAMNLAVRAGRLQHRPVFPTIEVKNTRTGFFEEAEFQAVMNCLPDYLKPLVEFLYLTGWRRGEVTSLPWRQVDLGAGIVRLEPHTTKNDEGRIFPTAALPPLARLLAEQRRRTDAVERERGVIVPWVFHRNGRRIHAFRKAWKLACASGGVENRLVHDFRRTAVRNLERAGVPRSVAMKLTGHKTEAVAVRHRLRGGPLRRCEQIGQAPRASGTPRCACCDRCQQLGTMEVEPPQKAPRLKSDVFPGELAPELEPLGVVVDPAAGYARDACGLVRGDEVR